MQNDKPGAHGKLLLGLQDSGDEGEGVWRSVGGRGLCVTCPQLGTASFQAKLLLVPLPAMDPRIWRKWGKSGLGLEEREDWSAPMST